MDVTSSVFGLLFAGAFAVDWLRGVAPRTRRAASLILLMAAVVVLWRGVSLPISSDVARLLSWVSMASVLLVVAAMILGLVREAKAGARE